MVNSSTEDLADPENAVKSGFRGNFRRVKIFYFGTFLTSFGSLSFVMGIPSFFVKNGIALSLVGLTIAVHRFSGLLAALYFGPQIDRFDSRRVILSTEFLAAGCTLGLVGSWWAYPSVGFWPFWFFCAARAAVLGVQSTSRNRLVKLLSAGRSEASYVVWLNKATQGAHALSALVGLVLITYGRFEYAIGLDGLSFVLGGATVWRLPDLEKHAERAQTRLNFWRAFKLLVHLHRQVFVLDLLLSLVVSGSILLLTKLSHGNATLVILYNLNFGVCIWLASVFAHSEKFRRLETVYWLVLLGGLGGLALELGDASQFAFYFLAYMGYWILYHKYTVQIQTGTPAESIGGVMAARGLLAVLVLSAGELIGGYLPAVLPLRGELMMRGLVAVAALGLSVWTGATVESKPS